MMRRYLPVLVVWLVAVVAVSPVPHAQSLADVARAEEARRKTVKRPGKVYTNDDLKASTDPVQAPSSAPPAPAPAAGTAAAAPAAAVAPGETGTTRDQKYWKDRITMARDTLAHDQVLLDAVQSRINALSTDFVNMSDPAQRAVIQANRNTAVAELDRLNLDIRAQTKAVNDIQEEARKAGVPPGWLR